ncbi:hypothetical protein QF042_004500 [Pedobacter sp. W3I1]|uniref:hypothetical protein n=1 Tax=Pedobacter sp. W3I1 TaxID=3042291 RepID=UPI00278B5359|nr:hypothetical protein [Pedobacter sp. W3I1]MDQ0640935.1 hypothetical protein [Pedobacter sp. W3I1]
MKNNELPGKIIDCAFELAIISFPGMIPADKSAKDAYKQLAGNMISKPVKSIKRVLPGQMRRLGQ